MRKTSDFWRVCAGRIFSSSLAPYVGHPGTSEDNRLRDLRGALQGDTFSYFDVRFYRGNAQITLYIRQTFEQDPDIKVDEEGNELVAMQFSFHLNWPANDATIENSFEQLKLYNEVAELTLSLNQEFANESFLSLYRTAEQRAEHDAKCLNDVVGYAVNAARRRLRVGGIGNVPSENLDACIPVGRHPYTLGTNRYILEVSVVNGDRRAQVTRVH